MTRRARRTHILAFQARVALPAIEGGKTLTVLAQQYDVQSNPITSWSPAHGWRFERNHGTGDAVLSVDLTKLHSKSLL